MKLRKEGNPVLSRRLAVALLVTLFAVLILATIAAAITAYWQSSDNQDETLLSVAHLLSTNQIEVQYDPKQFEDSDYDDGVRVWEIGGDNRHGFKIDSSKKNGFHTIAAKRHLWRVLVVQNEVNEPRFAIVQKLSVSTEIATNSAVNTALPLLFLFLLVPILITLIVRHSFKPLNKLTQRISHTDSLTLGAASKEDIPVEVLPFVSAIDLLLEKNEAYNQRQRRFIADAAHELRTPITALSLDIENLQKARDVQTKEARQNALSTSVQRLQRLVNQLLDLARAQSVDQQISVQVSLNELVKIQIAELYVLAEDKSIELLVKRNDSLRVLDSNNQLQHLIRNALSNAIKFTPEGGEIVVEIFKEHSQAVFSVADSGPGVSPEHLGQLHEPFYRPDELTTGNGAGLGLAICHEIAEKLKGRLLLENIQPTGFRFRFSLNCE